MAFGKQRPSAPWSQGHYWGQYDTQSDLPNVAGAALQLESVQAGDVAWSRADTALFVCIDPTQQAAVWQQIGASGPVSAGTTVQSGDGAWTVPSGVSIGDLVYVTGSFTADLADNDSTSTAPAVGVVIAKPTPTTATLAYFGETSVGGLTAGVSYFLGEDGGVTATAPSTPGEVVQRVGVAITSTILLFDPEQVSVVT